MASGLLLIVSLGADKVVIDIHTPFVSAKVHDCEALLWRFSRSILLLAKLQSWQRQTGRVWLCQVSLVSGQDMIPVDFLRLILIGHAETGGSEQRRRESVGFES